MLKRILVVLAATGLVAAGGVLTLQYRLPVGPLVLGLSLIPIIALRLSGHRLSAAVPDLVFGSLDTGLLAIPALAGAMAFGVAGAIAGGVIGDSLTDAIAGFFEGGVAEWLRKRGFEESREMVTTSLGKMAGCLLGSGLVLTVAMVFGIHVRVEGF
ncbi:MAG: hypothetical protein ACYTHM_11190 [Planctomycetota bacterium]|jgi:hypothetical protein